MTTANDEFEDLMPHRINVKGEPTGFNDYGKPTGYGNDRTYMCLIDDTTTTTYTADGNEVRVALTAYVAPVPIGATDGLPVDIEPGEVVQILSPRPQTRPLIAIDRHYDSVDGVGMLHNMVLRFS